MTNALAGMKASVFASTGVSTATTNEATTNAGDNKTFSVTNAAHRYLDPSIAVVVQTAKDEIQTVTITGAPTGGTFTLTFGGQTTSTIAYNATAATVQAALVALSSIGASNVTVSGSAGGPYTVEFVGALGIVSQALMTASGAGLTGGTTPSVAIAETQAGSTWATVSTGFTLQYCGGVVTFTAIVGNGTTSCRLSSANWLTVSQALQAHTADLQVQQDIADITTFASGGWKVKLPLLADATIKLSQWWVDVFYVSSMGNLVVIAVYTGRNVNQRFEGYGYIKTDGIKFDVKSAIDESIDVELSGPLYYIAS